MWLDYCPEFIVSLLVWKDVDHPHREPSFITQFITQTVNSDQPVFASYSRTPFRMLEVREYNEAKNEEVLTQ